MTDVPSLRVGTDVDQIGAQLVRNGLQAGAPLRAVISGTLQNGPNWSSSTQLVLRNSTQAMDLANELIDIAMRWDAEEAK